MQPRHALRPFPAFQAWLWSLLHFGFPTGCCRVQGGLAVNALGNAEILQYPKYKLNLYVVAVCFVAASGGLLFGARCC